MKLILHIGTEKTGTTSVQRWLTNNHAQLVKDRVFYSKVLDRPDNRKISVFARDADQPDDGFKRFDICSPQEHQGFCLDVEHLLTAEVSQAKELGIKFFIISSEHLHSRITTSEMVGRLKPLLLPLFDEIEVLCYLRPQAFLLQSRISVGLRQFSSGPHELKTYLEPSYYNYLNLWKRWSSSFSKVTMKPFDRCKDVVADICTMMDIDLSQYPERKRLNEKLDYRAGILSYGIGHFSSKTSIDKSFLRIFMNDLPVLESPTISRALASEINEKYHDSNLALTEIVDDLHLEDIEADLQQFPEEGNAEKMFDLWLANDFFGLVLARTNCEVYLERSLRKITEAERALCRNNLKNAKMMLDEASRILNNVKNNILEEENIFRPIITQIESIERRIESINSEINYESSRRFTKRD